MRRGAPPPAVSTESCAVCDARLGSATCRTFLVWDCGHRICSTCQPGCFDHERMMDVPDACKKCGAQGAAQLHERCISCGDQKAFGLFVIKPCDCHAPCDKCQASLHGTVKCPGCGNDGRMPRGQLPSGLGDDVFPKGTPVPRRIAFGM